MTEYIKIIYNMNEDVIRETFHCDDMIFMVINNNDIQILSCSQGLRKFQIYEYENILKIKENLKDTDFHTFEVLFEKANYGLTSFYINKKLAKVVWKNEICKISHKTECGEFPYEKLTSFQCRIEYNKPLYDKKGVCLVTILENKLPEIS